MSETLSSMCAKSVAPAIVSVDMSILSFVAHHPRERPVLFRYFLNDHMKVRGLGVGVLHHGLGDGANQGALLFRRPAGPHLYSHNGHALSSLSRILPQYRFNPLADTAPLAGADRDRRTTAKAAPPDRVQSQPLGGIEIDAAGRRRKVHDKRCFGQ